MSNDEIVNDDRSNNRRVNQFDSRKTSFYVNAINREKIKVRAIIFFYMFRRYTSHFNLLLICIFKTRTWLKNCFTTSQIFIDVCISNFAMFFVKCINSYLINAKTISWRRFYNKQCSCIFFNNRQWLIVLMS